MASKFEKEEKFCYDSNTDSDSESNNSKSRSGSSSPTAQLEQRIINETDGRRGGQCGCDYIECYRCQATCNLRYVWYRCDQHHRITLCKDCIDYYHHTCPWHRQSTRKRITDTV